MNLDLDKIRQEFPKGKIYLNNASVSLIPSSSIQAMNNFLIKYNQLGPDSLESENFISEILFRVRKTISKLVNCHPNEVILTQSTTDGINIVANGLLINSDSNIVLRGMKHEHHANYYPWLKLSQKTKIRNLKIDNNGFFDLKELEDLIDKKTSVVALSHALYNTGAILPVKKIGEFLEKNGIPFFLDAAQTVGCIGDYDFNQSKYNFMSFNGSKWLCGPMGTGIFCCKKNSSDLLEPMSIGGESAMLYDNSKLAHKGIPDKFQAGFRNYVGVVGMENSISLLLQIGLENIRKQIIKLANLFREELGKIPNITLYGPTDENLRTSIISFSLKGLDPKIVAQKLEKKEIILSVREIIDKKIIRASPHFFNTETEILEVINEIKKL